MSDAAREKDIRFRQVVVQPGRVRSAFAESAVVRGWWRAVLWLHGKPAGRVVGVEQAAECVASGFTFYGRLYSLLGVLFLVGTPVAGFLVYPLDAHYWLLLAGASGVYLLVAGRVAS